MTAPSGFNEVRLHGGATVVQDPAEAMEPSMPPSALDHVAVDHCPPLAAHPGLLVRLAAERGTDVGLDRAHPAEGTPREVEPRLAKPPGTKPRGRR